MRCLIRYGLIYGLLVIWLGACSSTNNKFTAFLEQNNSKTLRVNAYGSLRQTDMLAIDQDWQQAKLAAKLDGYRNLANLLYQEKLGDQLTVGSQVIKDESYRIYLDTFLRSAQVVDFHHVNDTVILGMVLNLTPNFYRCMAGDTAVINQCMDAENKHLFTRLGHKSASSTVVNLACATLDCGEQFDVQGFSKPKSGLDNALLDNGLYSSEWTLHTGLSLMGRLLLFQELIHGF